MVQLNLNLTEHSCSKDMTCFSFHTRASLCVHARLVMSNLLCKALVYALDVCTMHACMSGMHTPNLDYTGIIGGENRGATGAMVPLKFKASP